MSVEKIQEAILLQAASEGGYKTLAEIACTFGTFEGFHYSEVFICPECGEAWGRRVRRTWKPHQYGATVALCDKHGGGFYFRSADYDIRSAADVLSLNESTLEALINEYFRRPSVLTNN